MSANENFPTTSLESTNSSEISIWKPDDGFWGTLVVDLRTPEQNWADIKRAWETGNADPVHSYSFLSYEEMQKVLAPNRMAILRTMMGHGPMSIREVARRVGRDFKGVHSDVSSLTKVGFLYKTEDGQTVFPYDGIRFDFVVGGAALSAA